MAETFDVFISYSHTDYELVQRTLAEVRRRIPSLKVWIDREKINPGDDWSSTIVRAASEASLFLLFGSKNAFESHWVQREIGIALQKKILDKVPVVLLAQDKAAIPTDLAKYQYIDFASEPAGTRSLVSFLQKQFLGQPRMAMDSAIEYTFELKIKPGCKEKLAGLRDCDLRFKIAKALDRHQVAVIWGDVFEERMDDVLPTIPKANCTLELVLRTQSRQLRENLYRILCMNHPHIADVEIG